MERKQLFRKIVLEEAENIKETLVPAMAKFPQITPKQVTLKLPALLEFQDYHEIDSLAESLKGTGLYVKEVAFYEGTYHGILYTKEIKGSNELKQLIRYTKNQQARDEAIEDNF